MVLRNRFPTPSLQRVHAFWLRVPGARFCVRLSYLVATLRGGLASHESWVPNILTIIQTQTALDHGESEWKNLT